MTRRTLVTLLLLTGLLGPAETVVCTESDGRVGIEIGIGGRCADRVIGERSHGQVWESCHDSMLPEASATVARKGQLAEAAAVPPIGVRIVPLDLAREERRATSLLDWHPPPLQHDQIASVVLLR